MTDKTKPQRVRYRAEREFLKFAAFNGLIDEGGASAIDGRKAKKRASESWDRRGGRNVSGFHKATAPGAVTVRKMVQA